MPAKKPLPRESDGSIDIKKARKRMAGHRTNAEIAERAAKEIAVPALPRRVLPPAYLPASMHDEFKRTAKKLGALRIFCDLDYDMLARYFIARAAWIRAQGLASQDLIEGDAKACADTAKVANTYFGQCQSCAAALGLSITSRCRLVLPDAEKPEAEDPMTKMLRERAEKRKA